ncbi:all-trans retinoic acid-induced differentiation factor isoform X3 [Rhineura floridana]|uniref:all-trans retinoic acid-induced differentiation factor isoform X3 n=1 Tax=Rhineura floridana TaxID=261503 RepID=UPI002AC81C31|nr:all-trans retinoic acid-induced differentiation factor isoform X3 [Rhineura floridana]
MAAPGRPWPRSAEWPLLLLRLCLCLVAGGAGALAQVTGTEVRRAASAAASPSPLPVCGCCAGPVRNGSATAALCGSRAGAVRRGRCCLDGPPERETVVGLDLGNCSLLQLCPSFQEASTALVIDLTDNPLGRPPEEAFRGFTQLQVLTLPLTLGCPGGNRSWDNVTIQGSIRLCQSQKNPCNGSGELGWLCPEDSLCAPDGPGLSQCLCVGPFHGYKCLRQAGTISVIFSASFEDLPLSTSLLS